MAQATAISFSKFIVRLENPASPGTFVAPCGFNSRSLRKSKTTNEVDIPDCADEDAPAWVGREVRSLDWSVTGEGLLTEESYAAWKAFWRSTAHWKVQIETLFPGGLGSQKEEGYAHLTSLEQAGNRGDKVSLSVELSGDGLLDYV